MTKKFFSYKYNNEKNTKLEYVLSTFHLPISLYFFKFMYVLLLWSLRHLNKRFLSFFPFLSALHAMPLIICYQISSLKLVEVCVKTVIVILTSIDEIGLHFARSVDIIYRLIKEFENHTSFAVCRSIKLSVSIYISTLKAIFLHETFCINVKNMETTSWERYNLKNFEKRD